MGKKGFFNSQSKKMIIFQNMLERGLGDRSEEYLLACNQLGRNPEEDPILYQKLLTDIRYEKGEIKFGWEQ